MTGVYNKAVDICRYLVSLGRGLDLVDNEGNTAVMLCCKLITEYPEVSKRRSILADLILAGCNLELGNKIGYYPLGIAIFEGDMELVAQLVNGGCNINRVGKYGETPIFDAVDEDQLEMVKLLVLKGADIYVKNDFEERVLQLSKGAVFNVLLGWAGCELQFGIVLKGYLLEGAGMGELQSIAVGLCKCTDDLRGYMHLF
jgi:ankyrin repeat protein